MSVANKASASTSLNCLASKISRNRFDRPVSGTFVDQRGACARVISVRACRRHTFYPSQPGFECRRGATL